jgi:hypothetical protein
LPDFYKKINLIPSSGYLESFVKNKRIPLPKTPEASKFKNTKKISGNEFLANQKTAALNLEEKRVEEILKNFLTLEKIDQDATPTED